jgi:hypothetical protein
VVVDGGQLTDEGRREQLGDRGGDGGHGVAPSCGGRVPDACATSL